MYDDLFKAKLIAGMSVKPWRSNFSATFLPLMVVEVDRTKTARIIKPLSNKDSMNTARPVANVGPENCMATLYTKGTNIKFNPTKKAVKNAGKASVSV